MDKKLVYISGPYRNDDPIEVDMNILRAMKAAIAIWEAGHVAICPHLNTRHFDRYCDLSGEEYIDGDLLIVERCDAILMLTPWRLSEGARREHDHAGDNGVRIFYCIQMLIDWLGRQTND